MNALPVITIYSKPGCHLCDRAETVLQRCQQRVAFKIEKIDISGDPDLTARYGDQIPVIVCDGREIARHFVRERQVLDLLAQ